VTTKAMHAQQAQPRESGAMQAHSPPLELKPHLKHARLAMLEASALATVAKLPASQVTSVSLEVKIALKPMPAIMQRMLHKEQKRQLVQASGQSQVTSQRETAQLVIFAMELVPKPSAAWVNTAHLGHRQRRPQQAAQEW